MQLNDDKRFYFKWNRLSICLQVNICSRNLLSDEIEQMQSHISNGGRKAGINMRGQWHDVFGGNWWLMSLAIYHFEHTYTIHAHTTIRLNSSHTNESFTVAHQPFHIYFLQRGKHWTLVHNGITCDSIMRIWIGNKIVWHAQCKKETNERARERERMSGNYVKCIA